MSATYRSNFEELVATKLKLEKYETHKFKYVVPESTRTYCPDFELNPTVFLETKGRFTAADRKKHLQFRESNPNITIAFLFQEAYNTLSRSSKTTYADWATKNNFLWFDWKTQQTELQSFISKHSPKPHKVLSSLKANFRRKK